MTEVTGTAKGSQLIAEGYWIDSWSMAIEPDQDYRYEAIPWTEVTALWREPGGRPANPAPLRKYNTE